jgi:hypothetical protein
LGEGEGEKEGERTQCETLATLKTDYYTMNYTNNTNGLYRQHIVRREGEGKGKVSVIVRITTIM